MSTDTQTSPDKQIVTGPDDKRYSFSKGISQGRINKFFTNKGWVLKNGEWYTQSGESVKELKKLGKTSPVPNTGDDILKRRQSLDKMGELKTDIGLGVVSALPNVLGAVGGMLGRTPGAAFGGGLGEGVKDLVRDSLMDKKTDPKQFVKDVALESIKQGGFEYVGKKLGEKFFNLLNKMPHAVTQKGITLLPSDLDPNSKLMRYVEDMLGNLAPSARTMAEFREKQSGQIVAKLDKFAQGYAKFNGTSEEMGILVKKALNDGEIAAHQNLENLRRSLPQGKQNMAGLAKAFPNELQDYLRTYKNALAKAIIKSDKPEAIMGLIRGSGSSLEDVRILGDALHELKPETMGKVQNRLMRDIINETLTGSKDPVLKRAANIDKNFTGKSFKGILDSIGEDKLKAVYGPTKYEAIEKFTKLVGNAGASGQGSGVGRFLNLTFILPMRSGLGIKNAAKVAGMGIAANRAAKIITSPEGMKIYEGYIKAIASQSPRLISLARDEITSFNEKSDREQELEMRIEEIEYKKSLPSFRSNAPGTDTGRMESLQ